MALELQITQSMISDRGRMSKRYTYRKCVIVKLHNVRDKCTVNMCKILNRLYQCFGNSLNKLIRCAVNVICKLSNRQVHLLHLLPIRCRAM